MDTTPFLCLCADRHAAYLVSEPVATIYGLTSERGESTDLGDTGTMECARAPAGTAAEVRLALPSSHQTNSKPVTVGLRKPLVVHVTSTQPLPLPPSTTGTVGCVESRDPVPSGKHDLQGVRNSLVPGPVQAGLFFIRVCFRLLVVCSLDSKGSISGNSSVFRAGGMSVEISPCQKKDTVRFFSSDESLHTTVDREDRPHALRFRCSFAESGAPPQTAG